MRNFERKTSPLNDTSNFLRFDLHKVFKHNTVYLLISADILLDFQFDYSLRFVVLKYGVAEDSLQNSKFLYYVMSTNEKKYII